ncbi:hypothetical protein K9L67_04135 [Candidatus Woesearchaeota archaeon]|nr:hypothetical protein [Candidatus Woesearchaeota archaeon]MCF7901391.1 hypothetical protein [Candidatus Woesearchaeota archaeon]MCF8013735.1 hypothetical protein [Candidatus Woesearchaeota archaeon]
MNEQIKRSMFIAHIFEYFKSGNEAFTKSMIERSLKTQDFTNITDSISDIDNENKNQIFENIEENILIYENMKHIINNQNYETALAFNLNISPILYFINAENKIALNTNKNNQLIGTILNNNFENNIHYETGIIEDQKIYTKKNVIISSLTERCPAQNMCNKDLCFEKKNETELNINTWSATTMMLDTDLILTLFNYEDHNAKELVEKYNILDSRNGYLEKISDKKHIMYDIR